VSRPFFLLHEQTIGGFALIMSMSEQV